jgi:hypothetical protein
MGWQPISIRRLIRSFPTSARTALVETDAGPGYLKAMGNPEGLHTLACELVGTRMASWIGLSTLEFAILNVDDADEIPFVDASGTTVGYASPGPAFITRSITGETWSGTSKQLKQLSNPEDISRLVVFDTWTLNCDRHGPRLDDPLTKPRINLQNVFLSEEGLRRKLTLKAIDHTHCFTCGRALSTAISNLDHVKDQRVFGCYPEFIPLLDRAVIQETATRLSTIDRASIWPMLDDIPREWEVKSKVKDAWVEFIYNRARFVAETIERKLWPQQDLAFGEEQKS